MMTEIVRCVADAPLLIWTGVAWDVTVLVSALFCLGLLLLSSRAYENFWTGSRIVLALALGSIALFHLLHLPSPWYAFLADSLSGLAKVPMAVLTFIGAIVIGMALWRAPRVPTPEEDTKEYQDLLYANRGLGRRLRGFEQKALQLNLLKQGFIGSLLQTFQALAQLPQIGSVVRLEDRLLEFDRILDQLTATHWEPLSIKELVRRQMTLFEIDEDVVTRGNELLLAPHHVAALSLAIYELALNSIQHTERTQRGARYVIEWHVVERDGKAFLTFIWKEHTSQVLANMHGLGHTILTSLVPKVFDGEGRLTLTPHTVEWTLQGTLLDRDTPP